jgi:glucose/arabinose dehydrogenase
LGLRIYQGSQFPTEYEGNIFIAEHGSWNSQPPHGYKITRVQNVNGTLVKSPFLTGFIDNSKTCVKDADCPGTSLCQNRNGTGRPYSWPFYCSGWGRPSDIEVLHDGSVLVSDEQVNHLSHLHLASLFLFHICSLV